MGKILQNVKGYINNNARGIWEKQLMTVAQLAELGGGLSGGSSIINGGYPNNPTPVMNELNSDPASYFNKFNGEGYITASWYDGSSNVLFGDSSGYGTSTIQYNTSNSTWIQYWDD